MTNRKVTFDVYITNLPNDIDEEHLKKEFSSCGNVHSVLVREGKNGSSKFGFVRYFNEDAQEAAAVQLNGKYVQGKVLVVRKADCKKKTNPDGSNGEIKWHQKGDHQQAHGPRQTDPKPDVCEYIEQAILITYVVDACTVFAQLAHRDMAEVGVKLMTEINQFCPVAQNLGSDQPDLNKVYGALFSEDGMWYRCKVSPSLDKSSQQSTKVRVHYLDYGNDDVVDSSTLVELPMSLASLSPQAHMLVFRGIKPTAKSREDTLKAVQFLQGVTDGKSVMARLYRPIQTSSSSTPVEIYDGTSGLNDVLVQKGFAARISTTPAKSPLSTGAPSSGPSPRTSNSPLAQTKGNAALSSLSPKRGTNTGPGLLGTPPQASGNKRNNDGFLEERKGTWNPKVSKDLTSQMTGQEGAKMDKLQSEVAALKKEMMHLKTDKVELVKKCKDYLSEITKVSEEKDDLQANYQSVKEAASNTLSCLQKFEEKYKTSMQTKMTGLLQMLATLKQTRKQVVIDPKVRDPVEVAITLLTDSTTIAFVSLRDSINEDAVQMAQTDLCQHQAKFYQPGAKDKLDDLISARNKARQNTYDFMTTFLTVVDSLPLTEKKAKIESSLEELESTYHHMLYSSSEKPLTNQDGGSRIEDVSVCMKYRDWKEKKSQQLKRLRETTDTLAVEWQQTLQENLIMPFDLDFDTTVQSVPALDDLVRRLMIAMETEIAMTGQDVVDINVDPALLEKKKEEMGEEAAILSNTVRLLVKQLRRELDAIAYIRSCQASYMSGREELTKWLVDRPDVSALQAVQKTIKGLKSRLRHKLADKDDLDEEPELNDGGELQKIAEELASIRLELQKAFVEEDKLMEEVAELSRLHFPELAHLYPSFDIEHYLDTLGLIKRGRDLQQFDLKPLPGCDKKMIHLGEYNGRPVVIKSYFMADDAARQDFLIQSIKTLTYGFEGRLIADAVYAPSNLREVHVQLPYVQMGSLEAAIAQEGTFAAEPLTDDELLSIVHDVLTGIGQLQEHETSTVHGAIHPRNVLLTSRNSALLAEYDITKTAAQRAQQAYKSKNGLSFSPPELGNDAPASSAWDMYCFGLLLLWAHFPEVAFPAHPNSTPDLSAVEISAPLREAVSALLSPIGRDRPTAEQLKQFDLFKAQPKKEDIKESVEDSAGEDGRVEAREEAESGEDGRDEACAPVNSLVKDELPEIEPDVEDVESEGTTGQGQKLNAVEDVKVSEAESASTQPSVSEDVAEQTHPANTEDIDKETQAAKQEDVNSHAQPARTEDSDAETRSAKARDGTEQTQPIKTENLSSQTQPAEPEDTDKTTQPVNGTEPTLPIKTEDVSSPQSQQARTEETDKATPPAETENGVKQTQAVKIESSPKQSKPALSGVSSPSSRTLFLKKMVAAMATNVESAKDTVTTTQEESEI